jgi:hypothetical protein
MLTVTGPEVAARLYFHRTTRSSDPQSGASRQDLTLTTQNC